MSATQVCATPIYSDQFSNALPELPSASDDGITYGYQVGAALNIGPEGVDLKQLVLFQRTDLALPNYLAGETLSVYSRDPGTGAVGGTPLFTDFTLTSATPITTTYNPPIGPTVTYYQTTFTANSTYILLGGTSYWFVLTAPLSTQEIGWDYTLNQSYFAPTGITIPANWSAFQGNGSTNTFYSLSDGPQVFELKGIAVPEPTTIVPALIAGSIGLFAMYRRRNKPSR